MFAWTKTAESLPDREEFVLIANTTTVIPAIMFDGVWYAPDKTVIQFESVTHWAYLPEPPN